MATLPTEVTLEVQDCITALDAVLTQLAENQEKADRLRSTRNELIVQLRLNGFSLRQLSLLTGYSHGVIGGISTKADLVAARGAVRRAAVVE